MKEQYDPFRMGWIGLPYSDDGLDRPAPHCWGCVRMVFREAFGIVLPSYATTPSADAGACAAEIGSRSGAEWLPLSPGMERFGDVAVVHRASVPCHCGVVISPGRLLHCDKGRTSAVVPYPSPYLRGRVGGIFRHPALAGG